MDRRHHHSMVMPASKIAAVTWLDMNGQNERALLTPIIVEARARASLRAAGHTRRGIEKLTKAVCFNCGEFKMGAFNVCRLCKRVPETDDELVLSLALTDHYFDLKTLKIMGKDIQNGLPLKLDGQTRENLISALANLKETTGIKLGKPPATQASSSQKAVIKKARNLAAAKFLAIACMLMGLVMAAYVTAYPYRSYDECVNEEIKSGGTTDSAENFCWEQRDQGNLREFGLNPLREDFVIYGAARRVLSNDSSQFDPSTAQPVELNEAVATEGYANDTIVNVDAL